MSVDPPIRDAASVLAIRRDGAEGPAVLMGRRGARAAFMPSKVVFPGGAVDAGDAGVDLARPIGGTCASRLAMHGQAAVAALCAAAIRELAEETGLALGHPAPWPDAPAGWAGLARRGLRPDAAPLRYLFRAVTPPGRSRRFDARFFVVEAEALTGDTTGFPDADAELAGLEWVPLARARALDVPFVTDLVLAEAAALIALGPGAVPDSVPFFDNRGDRPVLRHIV